MTASAAPRLKIVVSDHVEHVAPNGKHSVGGVHARVVFRLYDGDEMIGFVGTKREAEIAVEFWEKRAERDRAKLRETAEAF